MTKLLTQAKLESLEKKLNTSLRVGLKEDYEVVEDVTDFQNECFKVYETIAEMIERWDEFAEAYREETEGYDNSDYEYEVRASK